jgi:hypothetical protein
MKVVLFFKKRYHTHKLLKKIKFRMPKINTLIFYQHVCSHMLKTVLFLINKSYVSRCILYKYILLVRVNCEKCRLRGYICLIPPNIYQQVKQWHACRFRTSDHLVHLIFKTDFYQSRKTGKIFSKKCISGTKSRTE